MKIPVCLLVALATITMSCRNDVIVEVSVPDQLEGSYRGTCSYSEIDPTGAIALSVSQPVDFVLGTESYAMSMPEGVAEEERQFCDVHGQCERMENVLVFFESAPGTVVCSHERDPLGEFAVDWITDSLRLYQETQPEEGVRRIKAITLAPK